MCAGISLSWRDFPDLLIERHDLRGRVVSRTEGGDREIRFMYRDPKPVLPVWDGDRLTVLPWGNQDPESRLPRTGWVRVEDLKAGLWRELAPEPVEVPATFGYAKGVWFQIRQGVRGVVMGDERSLAHVYMLIEPASHYFAVMTRADVMPVLIGERI
jgi:hypothetical protein